MLHCQWTDNEFLGSVRISLRTPPVARVPGLLYIHVLCNHAGIDDVPSTVITVSGDLAEFHCSAFCGIVAWLVNETSVFSLQQKHNLSYLSGPRSDGIHGEMSTLQIVANESVNNTMIRCIVINPDYNTIVNSSTIVYLLVQGTVDVQTLFRYSKILVK